jgi:uncharacterized repeat protein (TIGR02543 family)
MNSVFNLPQGITSVGDNFARDMFSGCGGAKFCMNSEFNLPQKITSVGNYFAAYMFYGCGGAMFCMNSVFNLPQEITGSAGIYFADHMFSGCGGDLFTMNSVFNLPQKITSVGNNFAAYMFRGCGGAKFCMNEVFNLPQEITSAGIYFASNMFSGCSGVEFTMNSVFNLPQKITSVGNNFASYMFSGCRGVEFVVNDVFTFPTVSTASGSSAFYQTFYNLGVNSLQRRTATSIIGSNTVPASNMATFFGSDCFVDRRYIAVNWGGGGLTITVTYNPGTHGTWTASDETYTGLVPGDLMPVFGTKSGATIADSNDPEFIFVGWSTDGGVTIIDTNDLPATVTNSVTYVAIWSKHTYTVVFAPGTHGTWTASDETYTDLTPGDAIPVFGTKSGATITSSNNPDYTFTNWNPTVPTTIPDNPTSGSGTVTVLTYTAQWKYNAANVDVEESTVTYRGNGATSGAAPVDNNWYTYGDRVTVLGQGSLVRTGYSFLGWSQSSTATAAEFTAGSTFNIYNDADVVLFAVWGQNVYTVTFAPGTHGTFTAQTTIGLHYGDSTPAAPTVTGETGWTFTGWLPTLSATVTDNTVYTAQWTQTTPTPTPTGSPSPSPSASATPTPSNPTSPTTTPPPTTTITPMPTSTIPATPTATGDTNPPSNDVSKWSAVNLLLSIIGAVLAVLAVAFTLLNGKMRQSKQKPRLSLWLITIIVIVVVLAVVGVLVFLLTQDFSLPMGWIINKWTTLHAALVFIETITAYLYIKTIGTK